jgi:hypothetical protein
VVALALALPATSSGAGSTLGLGATLGTGSRLIPGLIGSLITVALLVLILSGFGAVVVSLVAPRIGWIVNATLVGLVFTVGIVATASLGTRSGPAIAVLNFGAAALAIALWIMRNRGGQR